MNHMLAVKPWGRHLTTVSLAPGSKVGKTATGL